MPEIHGDRRARAAAGRDRDRAGDARVARPGNGKPRRHAPTAGHPQHSRREARVADVDNGGVTPSRRRRARMCARPHDELAGQLAQEAATPVGSPRAPQRQRRAGQRGLRRRARPSDLERGV
jgi:hypothetical protein